MTHYPAITCIQKRIEEINKDVITINNTIDTSQLPHEVYLAEVDLENSKTTLKQLQNSLKKLLQ